MTLLTRSRCRLCTDAASRLRSAARWLRVEMIVTDITSSPELEDEYHLRIPVVLGANGRVLAEGRISRSDAVRAAWRARRQT